MEPVIDWIGKFLGRLFGTQNERLVRRYRRIVQEHINPLDDRIKAMSDDEMRALSKKLRERAKDPATIEELLPEAFALCREAGRRTVKMRHFDVQLIGGLVLHEGNIAEMITGEGKTLVATLPAYLNSLTGRGVHVITVNDYLARRDAQWMGPIYHFLGASVGVIQHEESFLFDPTHRDDPADRMRHLRPCTRQEAYAADITYGTNNEFGFDYLRDNMKIRRSDQVQRGHAYAIVDEVDSILVDEARTPLIISGPSEDAVDKYYTADKVARSLERGEETLLPDRTRKFTGDFVVKEKEHAVILTDAGILKAERLVGVDTFYSGDNMDWPHYIETALKAHHLYRLDREYVIKDGEVIIVDEFTGRMMPGRRWSDGQHQAVEAKHNLRIQQESQTYATITLQHYFKLYAKLAGMTGSAATEATEFERIYGLGVVVIPTNRPLVRDTMQDVILGTEREKFDVVEEEIDRVHKTGRPILVGTTSIEKSEIVSERLKMRGIKHELLNAKHHEREASIVAKAGEPLAVTIATNMAGRGTDIILGSGVASLGGLHVIGTERHESRRIDNQLRGRCGRQGDPGSSQFFLSLEDDVFRKFAPPWMKTVMQKMGLRDGERIENRMVTNAITRAQKNVEARNFDIRKNLVEYDKVRSEQRRVIYELRQRVLEGRELKETALGFAERRIAEAIDRFFTSEGGSEPDVTGVFEWFRAKFGEAPPEALAKERDRGRLEEALLARMNELYAERELTVGRRELRRQVRRLADWAFQDGGIHEKTLQVLSEKLQSEFGVEIPSQDLAHGDVEAVVLAAADGITRIAPERLQTIAQATMRAGEQYVLLSKIDEKWKDLLYNMDQLRDVIGLRGYAQMDPKQEFKREGMLLFKDMMHAIEEDVTSVLFRMQLVAVDEERLARRWGAVRLQKDDFALMKNMPEEGNGASSEEGPRRPVVVQKRPGRNDACYCGSGKKYKKCHLPKDDHTAAAATGDKEDEA